MAPIVGENRAIARLGLERLRTRAAARASPRSSSGPGSRPAAVDLETVSFALAPRLNAAGRMGEALEAARLLLAEDPPTRPPSTPMPSRRPTSTAAT